MILRGEQGFLEVSVLQRRDCPNRDFWDANWLASGIHVQIVGFNGSYNANLRVDMLQQLHADLVKMLNLSTEKLNFIALEEGLSISCKMDARGHVSCLIGAKDEHGTTLKFNLDADFSSIARFETQLKRTLEKYPLIVG